MDKNIQIILDYVEGRLPTTKFQYEFNNNIALQQLLNKKVDLLYLENYNFSVYNFLKNEYTYKFKNWDTIYLRRRVQTNLMQWLDFFGIKYNQYDQYSKDVCFLLDIQPSWLDIDDDQGIFDKILKEIPKDVSKTQQIKWGKAKIKELFRYDKTYPRWVQDPEWPIVNGKPLVFSHQSKEKKDDERVYYYFYDPETKEQVVIEQFY